MVSSMNLRLKDALLRLLWDNFIDTTVFQLHYILNIFRNIPLLHTPPTLFELRVLEKRDRWSKKDIIVDR